MVLTDLTEGPGELCDFDGFDGFDGTNLTDLTEGPGELCSGVVGYVGSIHLHLLLQQNF